MEEILGNSDNDLEVKEEIIEKLRAQRNSRKNRVTMDEIVQELGVESK
jgi:signal recognition particle GTPase